MQDNNDIASRVKEIRKVLDLTQKQMAMQLKVSISTICEIENEKHKPNCEFLENIARVFNVNLYWLLFGEVEKFFNPTLLLDPGNEFSARIEDIREFIWYFQRSFIVQHSVLAHFLGLLISEKPVIDKEIKEIRTRFASKKNPGDGREKF